MQVTTFTVSDAKRSTKERHINVLTCKRRVESPHVSPPNSSWDPANRQQKYSFPWTIDGGELADEEKKPWQSNRRRIAQK